MTISPNIVSMLGIVDTDRTKEITEDATPKNWAAIVNSYETIQDFLVRLGDPTGWGG